MMFWRVVSVCVVLQIAGTTWAQGSREDYQRADRLRELTGGKVGRDRVEPHWFADNTRFWYRNSLLDGREGFIVVDAAAGSRKPAFDHQRLAAALSKATGETIAGDRLPFNRIEFADDGAIRFNAEDKGWIWDDAKHQLTGAAKIDVGMQRPRRRIDGRRANPPSRDRSPDGKWIAFVKDHKLWLRETDGDDSVRLSDDGNAENPYDGKFYWSPDSSKLVATRTRKVPQRLVHLVESSPPDQVQPKLHSFEYLKPGDHIAMTKPRLFDIRSLHKIDVDDDLFETPWSIKDIRWRHDSSGFTFLYNQRGHQVLRIVSVDANTGEADTIVDEQSPTFIDYAHKEFTHWVDGDDEIIWMSERDGWNHLYLIDSRTGEVINQITSGQWVVRGVDRVDSARREIWFRAGGIRSAQDPYYIHHCRVNFNGSGLVVLTGGDGTHEIEFSPDDRFFLDTYSRVDQPPITELRRAADGSLVCEVERADCSALLETGWQTPERFVSTGRDDTTDIYGVIFRPTNFDPQKKYPVIEKVYAGPHGAFVPKRFASFHQAQEIAELGFIVAQIDGMGTSHRSKAFHDMCWKNLADSGFPDRIRWIKAAAETRPWMDIRRVGIFGGSAGGQSAARALLAHGDFYKVAVADCGCHDNRMDKIWWNELWMGWPVGPHYREQSNVTNAHRLTGKLLLIVGELDRNVDPASTMQVANALIKADKDFDLLVIPGAGHGSAETPYGRRRRRDFFVRHLLGVEPRWQPQSLATPSDSDHDEPDSKGGKIEHAVREIEGWQVHVDRRLLHGDAKATGEKTLQVLANQLFKITLIVPDDRLARLREVPIWIDRDHPLGNLQYHPSVGWLRDHGHDPAMAKAVHVPNASRLIRLQQTNDQPYVMLHELAHAYHDRVLGFDNEEIIRAYDHVVAGKGLESVRHIRGHETKHYALTNHKEFFAEMTECYLGTNDFYPFVRGELQEFDEATFELMKKIWRVAQP